MMNVQVGDKMGSGIYGTAYKAKYNDIDCIYKVEKAINNFSVESQFIRQGKFDELARKYPNQFMHLLAYGTIINCDHKNEIPDDGSKNTKRMIEFYNKQKICRYYFYVPLMDGTLSEVSSILSKKEYIKMIVDILSSINIMGKNGWEHRDLHQDNIMYIKNGSEYQWYLIDYGRVYNVSFAKTDYDKKISELYISDLHTFLLNTIIQNDVVMKINREKKRKWMPFDSALKLAKKIKNYGYIRQALVSVKAKNLKYEMLALWISANDYELYAKIANVELSELSQVLKGQGHAQEPDQAQDQTQDFESLSEKSETTDIKKKFKLEYSSLISVAAKNLLKYDITPVVAEAKRLMKLVT